MDSYSFLAWLVANYNYLAYALLMTIGLYAMVARNNLVRKLIGMSIFQTAIILFYVSIGTKFDATIPIIEHGHGVESAHQAINAAHYMNPLPHVLMLTAIVVAVATLGVALSLAIKVFEQYGTLEENEIIRKIEEQ